MPTLAVTFGGKIKQPVGRSAREIFIATDVTRITLLSLYNSAATTQNITVYMKESGHKTRFFRRIQLDTDESCDVITLLNAPLMNPGDSITASASLPDSVDFTISGEVMQ